MRWVAFVPLRTSALTIALGALFATASLGQDASDGQREQVLQAVSREFAQRKEPDVFDWLRLADAQLRSGRVSEANDSFETAIRLEPPRRPYLWQYGISLFFAERFDEGRALFEAHRKVNPNDVENAAWHFLCVAKSEGVDKARTIVLLAPDDPRPPMREILDRLRGGDDSKILARMRQLEAGADAADATFYGEFYLGLIADAEGDRAKAKRWIGQAAQTPLRHYMADVARVYRTSLSEDKDGRESKPEPAVGDGSAVSR